MSWNNKKTLELWCVWKSRDQQVKNQLTPTDSILHKPFSVEKHKFCNPQSFRAMAALSWDSFGGQLRERSRSFCGAGTHGVYIELWLAPGPWGLHWRQLRVFCYTIWGCPVTGTAQNSNCLGTNSLGVRLFSEIISNIQTHDKGVKKHRHVLVHEVVFSIFKYSGLLLKEPEGPGKSVPFNRSSIYWEVNWGAVD